VKIDPEEDSYKDLVRPPATPTDVIGGILRIRRDLAARIKSQVLPNSGLTLEQVDLLFELYGQRSNYLTFSYLKDFVVHSPELVSRRISELEAVGLVQTRKTKDVSKQPLGRKSIDAKSKCVRITDEGVSQIEPIYKRYRSLCETLLEGSSEPHWTAVAIVLEGLRETIWGGQTLRLAASIDNQVSLSPQDLKNK
jgi:hypothetical protein